MEITLDDLLVLEPRLAWRARGTDASETAAEERPRRFVGCFRTHDRAPSASPSRR